MVDMLFESPIFARFIFMPVLDRMVPDVLGKVYDGGGFLINPTWRILIDLRHVNELPAMNKRPATSNIDFPALIPREQDARYEISVR